MNRKNVESCLYHLGFKNWLEVFLFTFVIFPCIFAFLWLMFAAGYIIEGAMLGV